MHNAKAFQWHCTELVGVSKKNGLPKLIGYYKFYRYYNMYSNKTLWTVLCTKCFIEAANTHCRKHPSSFTARNGFERQLHEAGTFELLKITFWHGLFEENDENIWKPHTHRTKASAIKFPCTLLHIYDENKYIHEPLRNQVYKVMSCNISALKATRKPAMRSL